MARLGRPPVSLRQRFDDKWMPEPNSGCWLWLGAIQGIAEKPTDVRPRMWDGKKSEYAYRVAWSIYRGPIPRDLELRHTCDVPSCVNPNHLTVGTRKQNMADCVARGRTNKPRGEAAPTARLTEISVRAIRASDEPSKRIARRLGIHDKTVRDIRRGVTWRHI